MLKSDLCFNEVRAYNVYSNKISYKSITNIKKELPTHIYIKYLEKVIKILLKERVKR